MSEENKSEGKEKMTLLDLHGADFQKHGIQRNDVEAENKEERERITNRQTGGRLKKK